MVNRTYRYFAGDTSFGFGFGLSYTSFAYSNLELPTSPIAPCQVVSLTVSVINTGKLSGSEVVQVYITFSNTSVPMPLLQLWNFTRIYNIDAGSSQLVKLSLSPRSMAIFRDGDFEQIIEPGVRNVWVGGGQPGESAGLAGTFTVTGNPTPLSLCGEGATNIVQGGHK